MTGAGWKVSLPCTPEEAHALQQDIAPLALLDEPPVLVASEAEGSAWRLDAFFERKPGAAMIAMLKAIVPSAAGLRVLAEKVVPEDWVAISQQGLDPIREGPFFVHTAAHRALIPETAIAIEIEAGRAFGTGHHETTSGCLAAMAGLKARGAAFRDIIDIGTGTGLLAFAALRLWPAARVAASDNDPVAIDVARENMTANRIGEGRGRGRIELAVAEGVRHRRIAARTPFDLVIANILAGPLVALAPSIARTLRPGGMLVLAGLLDAQAAAVENAYRRERLLPLFRLERGGWPTLVMRKRRLWSGS